MTKIEHMKLENKLLHRVRVVLAGCALGCSPLAGAVNVANVSIVNFAFSPATVNISVNDSVKWTWAGAPHSTTSDTGLWDSGIFGTGATFTRVFTSAGSFPYHCTVHPFMQGAINVQAANVPPQITISSPANGSVVAAPATIDLSATATDSDGTVTNVQFLQGTALLRNVANPPYSATARDLAAGDYLFSAVASDNGGVEATNTITIHVVTPVPIFLSKPQRPSRGSFQFSYSVNPGLRYVVRRSADLIHWIPLVTNTATTSTAMFLDQNATGSVAFYQVGRLPNP